MIELVHPAREQSPQAHNDRGLQPTPANQQAARRGERLRYYGPELRKLELAYRRSLAEGREAAIALLNEYFSEGGDAREEELKALAEFEAAEAAWFNSGEFDDLPQQ